MVCSCGRTFENHLLIDLTNENIRARWINGDVNIERDFAELDQVLKK